MQGVWVWSVVGEIRSHMLLSEAKRLGEKKMYASDLYTLLHMCYIHKT